MFIGQSPEIQSLLRSAKMVAATDVTVLVLGESGTGKELLAQTIHQESHRSSGPFIAINCSALPETLVESELFGHKKGAFTDATENNIGRIMAASGGTLFLDEIGELPFSIQAKLLRFLETGDVQAVGEAHPKKSNVRVVAATNRDLHQEVKAGNFRADLYYRLNIVPLELPPLRHRHSDIPIMVKAFFQEFAQRYAMEAPSVTKAALKKMEHWHWPGNVRELRNFCERSTILFNGQVIDTDNLPLELPEKESDHSLLSEFKLPEDGIHFETLEREMITQALARADGNRSQAAKLLGLTRDTFLYRMKKHALS